MTTWGRRADRHGFTLIELMMVVGILGILASIAIPNFIRYQFRAKQAEVSLMFGNIKTGQQSYYAAQGCYEQINSAPGGAPSGSGRAWNPPPSGTLPCDGNAKEFPDLAIVPTSGTVYMTYACAVNANRTEHTCNAIGDLDGDGQLFEQMYCSENSVLGPPTPTNGSACVFGWIHYRTSVATF